MDTIIYSILTFGYLILFTRGSLFAKHHGWMKMRNVVLFVILALFYDNGILSLGKYIGEGDLLKGLNEARYWFHALFTPLLTLFAWNTLIRANLQWAKKRTATWIVYVLTLCLIISELITGVWGMSLEPNWENGILSYDKAGEPGNPPIMLIGVMSVLILTSIIIWWKQKWPWYFAGVLVMGLTPLIIRFFRTETLHNVSEFILMVALLATMAFQDQHH